MGKGAKELPNRSRLNCVCVRTCTQLGELSQGPGLTGPRVEKKLTLDLDSCHLCDIKSALGAKSSDECL